MVSISLPAKRGLGEVARQALAVDVLRQLGHERVPARAVVQRDEARTLLLQAHVRVLRHPAHRLGQRRIDQAGLQRDAHAAGQRRGIARLHDGHGAGVGHRSSVDWRTVTGKAGTTRWVISSASRSSPPCAPMRQRSVPHRRARPRTTAPPALAGRELHAALDLQAARGQRVGGHHVARAGPVAVGLDGGLGLEHHGQRRLARVAQAELLHDGVVRAQQLGQAAEDLQRLGAGDRGSPWPNCASPALAMATMRNCVSASFSGTVARAMPWASVRRSVRQRMSEDRSLRGGGCSSRLARLR
jgi:hypothetical protein